MKSLIEVHWGEPDDPATIERLVREGMDALMERIVAEGLTDTDVSATLRVEGV